MTEARRLRLGIVATLASSGAPPALPAAGCAEVTIGPIELPGPGPREIQRPLDEVIAPCAAAVLGAG